MRSASIIPYRAQARTDIGAAIGNKLMIRDKIDVYLGEAAGRIPEICRVVIHDKIESGPDQVDCVLVYSSASPFARWGLARSEGVIMLWQCSDGAELGVYHTMRAALTAIEAQAARLRAAGA